jgi:hypothetical protein
MDRAVGSSMALLLVWNYLSWVAEGVQESQECLLGMGCV